MTRATLADILPAANAGRHAVPGFVCLGWEDARAYVAAGEAENAPIILQVGPGARANMPLLVWERMLAVLADRASIPVVIHLDHSTDVEECRLAAAHAFTSVMYDGSQLPLDENIARTREVVRMARLHSTSVEGELGFVGYASGERDAVVSNPTDPAEAERFVRETGVDALAVSIGNVHLQTEAAAIIDWDRLSAIASRVDVPLVLHGASGIAHEDRRRLADWPVGKMNVGTELRQVFGQSLRDTLAANPERFDRVRLLQATEGPLTEAARAVIRSMRSGPDDR